MDIGEEDFYALAEEVLATLPEELLDGLESVAIAVEDRPEDGSETLGAYGGTALTGYDSSRFGVLSDRVVLFCGPLSRMYEDEGDLSEEISITLVHEVGHYHDIDEERFHELDWG